MWRLVCPAVATATIVLLGCLLALPQQAPAQTAAPAPASGGPVDPTLIADLVVANHILADQGVLDGFGHVSVRHPGRADRFLLSRSLAPALVTADDILEYDLEGDPVDAKGRASFLERFIHGEIYRARPDVNAVIHSHAPSVIPFSIAQVPLRPIYHMASFLSPSVPVFDIRKVAGMTNMLIADSRLGKALAEALHDRPVVLMRGHGYVAVGPSLTLAVFRAIYTEINGRLEATALGLGGGPITFLAPEEAAKATQTNEQVHLRAWELWKRTVLAKEGK